MLNEEERGWIAQLIHQGISDAVAAEREVVNAALIKHVRSDDHIAFRAFVDEQQRKKERWEKITTSVLGAVIIGTLFWVGSHALQIAAWIVRQFGE